MLIRPRIEVKAIEGDAVRSDRDDGHRGAHFAVEAVLVHAEIPRRIAKAQKSGRANQAVEWPGVPIGAGVVLNRRFRAFRTPQRQVLTHDA